MSSIPNPPEHTNENTTNTATQTRIGTRLRPSATSLIGYPPAQTPADARGRRRAGRREAPRDAHTIRRFA